MSTFRVPLKELPMEAQNRIPHPRQVTPEIQELVERFEEPQVASPPSISCSAPSPVIGPGTISLSELEDPEGVEHQNVNLDQAFPRVAMTPSMLYTYAYMRGKGGRRADPVHHSLYPVPNRSFGAGNVWIPMVRERGSMDELYRGAVFFWDPLVPRPETPPSSTASASRVPTLESKMTKSLTYPEFKEQFPTTVGKNHYKGGTVYANFGYLRDEETNAWIDPDSSGLLRDEYLHLSGSDDTDKGGLADFQRSEKSGPRILTGEENEAFYQEYLDYVHDDVDAEGDPRNFRITPAIFAQWAAAAQKGDHYEEETFTPDSIIWSKRVLPKDSTRNRRIRPRGQFDIETGSVMSGVYELEKGPSLLTEAEGVDMPYIPLNFSRSWPAVARDLDKKVFPPPSDDSEGYITSSSTVTELEVFNEKAAMAALVECPGGSGRGTAELEGLRQETERTVDEVIIKNRQRKYSSGQRHELEREITFLKARLEQEQYYRPMNGVGLGLTMTITSMGSATSYSADHSKELTNPATAPSNAPTPTPLKKLRKQYRRYFKEEIQRARAEVGKTKMFENFLANDLQDIIKDIGRLRVEKDDLLHQFGVGRVEDIPNLHIPRPEYRRVEFGDD